MSAVLENRTAIMVSPFQVSDCILPKPRAMPLIGDGCGWCEKTL